MASVGCFVFSPGGEALFAVHAVSVTDLHGILGSLPQNGLARRNPKSYLLFSGHWVGVEVLPAIGRALSLGWNSSASSPQLQPVSVHACCRLAAPSFAQEPHLQGD